MTTEKTIIHFHQNEMVEVDKGFGKSEVPKVVKRTLEVDGHHLHWDVVRMLKDSGYKPIDNRVMLEYV